MTLPKYATRAAAKGASVLDSVWPGWWRKVKITRLRMDWGYLHDEKDCGCVLAQLDGTSYGSGLVELEARTGSEIGVTTHGFDVPDSMQESDTAWDNLTEAWKEEIRARRRAAAR